MVIGRLQLAELPLLVVDCIGLNMTKIPDVIPKGTARCNFTYNFVSCSFCKIEVNKRNGCLMNNFFVYYIYIYIALLWAEAFPSLEQETKKGDIGVNLSNGKLFWGGVGVFNRGI